MYLFQILVLELRIVPGETENAIELVHALSNIRRKYQDSDTVPRYSEYMSYESV